MACNPNESKVYFMVPWWLPRAAVWWVEEREEWFILDVKTRSQTPGSKSRVWCCVFPVKPALSRDCLERYHVKGRIQQPPAISKEQNWFFTFLQVNSSTPFSPVLVCRDSKLPRWKISPNVPCVPTQPPWCCSFYLFSPSALWEID